MGYIRGIIGPVVFPSLLKSAQCGMCRHARCSGVLFSHLTNEGITKWLQSYVINDFFVKAK
jgi:hypothetical protein